MADMLGNALSALTSYQRALATTSHNIANADTEGYSRQRVDFATRVPQQMGDLSIGSGVTLSDVRRVYDEFAGQQLRSASGAFSQLDNYYQLASQLDNTLSDSELGLSAALSDFYDSVQNLANDPASLSARQLLLSEAESLSGRFSQFASQLDTLDTDINNRIQASVNDINDLAGQVAKINSSIAEAQGKFGSVPGDLLDQRDQALLKLNELVNISTVEQDDGSVNVFIGNGQSLVLGEKSNSLHTVRSAFEADRLEVSTSTSETGIISDVINGGSLGASLSFRDGLLSDTRNELGRIASAVASSLNDQNAAGLDLYGQRGSAIFAQPAPTAIAATTNDGDATIAASLNDVSALDGRNIAMRFDGTNWQFNDAGTGQSLSNWTGSGTAADPFVIDGVSISLSGSVVAGDRFLVKPTESASAKLTVVMSDPAQLAAAAATRSGASSANTGSASISETLVVDPNHPNLTDAVSISFLDASTYSINGAGSYSYAPGEAITINGNTVTITGTPAAGDVFSITENTGASGDNRNMLAMADVESLGILSGGSASVKDAVSGLVGDIAVATRSAELNRDAQQNLLTQAQATVESISGVNLDEEASNLLKFQQAYQAAAQAASVANQLFQSLIGAIS